MFSTHRINEGAGHDVMSGDLEIGVKAKKLPKRITLFDILYNKNGILNLVDTFGMDIPEDVDGKEFKKIFDKWATREGYTTNYYFAEELRKGLNKYLLKTQKESV